MPRLARGGKWVYGWVVVGPGPSLPIPPAAWRKYSFQAAGEALLLAGSRTSGGFGLANAARHPAHLATRVLCCARFDEYGRAALPATAPVQPGDQLLAVLGSGYALGFLARGPIYNEGNPLKNGLATLIAFIVAGSIPLLVYLAGLVVPVPAGVAFPISVGLSALALFGLGAAKVLVTGQKPLRNGVEMLLVGGLAAAVAYAVGVLLRGLGVQG